MKSIEVLALGEYKSSDLKVSVSESTRKIDPIVDGKLEAVWKVKKKKADEQGKVCYNGLSYRLNSLEKIGNGISVDFGIIEYKVRDGLIEIPEYFDLPEEFYRKGCYSMASVKTVDDRYLMVELSGKSMNNNVCFYYEVILSIPSSELQNRFKTENKDQDIKSLKYLSKDEYAEALKNHNSQNKQFIPEILSI